MGADQPLFSLVRNSIFSSRTASCFPTDTTTYSEYILQHTGSLLKSFGNLEGQSWRTTRQTKSEGLQLNSTTREQLKRLVVSCLLLKKRLLPGFTSTDRYDQASPNHGATSVEGKEKKAASTSRCCIHVSFAAARSLPCLFCGRTTSC